MLNLGEFDIGYFSYTDAYASDDFLPLVERLTMSPVWVLATPLYWYSMSAQAKTFIDRLSDLVVFRKDLGRRLRGTGFAVVCAGTDPALPRSFDETFELTCAYLGMRFLGSHYAQFNGRTLNEAVAAKLAAAFGSKLCEEATRRGRD